VTLNTAGAAVLTKFITAGKRASRTSKYDNHYSLDGRPLGTDHSVGLVATNAVASLAATKPLTKKFTDELWKAPVPTGQYRYYHGMLYLLGLLHATGEFRIWPPSDVPAK
jgi:oligosaccharide reducing-end xylanase